jgi:uncharacterized membrane protein
MALIRKRKAQPRPEVTGTEEGLFIITFPDEHKATLALEILKNLNKHKDIRLKRGATIVRHSNGCFEIKETHDLNLSEKRLGAIGVTGAVIATIISAPLGPGALFLGAAIGVSSSAAAMGVDMVVDMGFKDNFLREIEESMEASSSAVVAIADFTNPEKAIQELDGLCGGKIIQHTLTPEIYEKLAFVVEDATTDETPNEEEKSLN